MGIVERWNKDEEPFRIIESEVTEKSEDGFIVLDEEMNNYFVEQTPPYEEPKDR